MKTILLSKIRRSPRTNYLISVLQLPTIDVISDRHRQIGLNDYQCFLILLQELKRLNKISAYKKRIEDNKRFYKIWGKSHFFFAFDGLSNSFHRLGCVTKDLGVSIERAEEILKSNGNNAISEPPGFAEFY